MEMTSLLGDIGLEWDKPKLLLMLIKIGMITLVALILGIDREIKQKPVGVKTLVIIGVTSCILTMISIDSVNKMMELNNGGPIPDPMRLPAQIVSGIGFLGAGVIFVKRSQIISGLTTAAIVWGVANLGIAIGAGYTWEVIVAVIVILLAIEGLPNVLSKVGIKRKKKIFISLKFNSDEYLTSTLKHIKNHGLIIKDVSIKKEDDIYKLDIVVSANEDEYVTEIYKFLNKQIGVVAVEIKQ